MTASVSKSSWALATCLVALGVVSLGCSDDGDDMMADDGTGTTGTTGDGGTTGTNGTPGDGGAQDADAYYVGSLSAALGAENNEADCALCHSNDGTQEGLSGKTLMDIAYRTSYKGGDAPDLLAATNACVTGWMGGEALEEGDAEWQSLKAYLESISSESVTEPNPIAPEVLEDEAAYEAAYAGGDATAGESAYQQACASCHDNALTLGVVPSFNRETIASRSIGRIAQKVRTSGPPPSGTADPSDSTPGPMPFFEPSDLPVEDLQNIIAYLKN